MYILGHALIASLSQRLVKTVCPACHKTKVAVDVFGSTERCDEIGLESGAPVSVADRAGCDLCNNTGFLGRTLALEAMFPPEDQASRRVITEMLISNSSSSIVDVPGTVYIPRRQSLIDLIRRQAIDADMGAALLVEEAATRVSRA